MSYVRWSSPGRPHDYDSAVYIYDTENGVVCCACILLPADAIGDHPSHVEPTPGRMIEHVQAHIAAGDAVPDFVIPGLADAERAREAG